jgi:hypothetical protein
MFQLMICSIDFVKIGFRCPFIQSLIFYTLYFRGYIISFKYMPVKSFLVAEVLRYNNTVRVVLTYGPTCLGPSCLAFISWRSILLGDDTRVPDNKGQCVT